MGDTRVRRTNPGRPVRDGSKILSTLTLPWLDENFPTGRVGGCPAPPPSVPSCAGIAPTARRTTPRRGVPGHATDQAPGALRRRNDPRGRSQRRHGRRDSASIATGTHPRVRTPARRLLHRPGGHGHLLHGTRRGRQAVLLRRRSRPGAARTPRIQPAPTPAPPCGTLQQLGGSAAGTVADRDTAQSAGPVGYRSLLHYDWGITHTARHVSAVAPPRDACLGWLTSHGTEPSGEEQHEASSRLG